MISIIIPACGQVALTRRCVESIRAHTAGEYEFVIVSNGSTPAEAKMLASMCDGFDGHYIHYPKMLGYPAAINAGVAVARGEHLCLMNNDAAFTGPWDARLSAALEHGEIVSPIVDQIAQPAQRLGSAPGRLAEVGMLFFVCVVMRRATFVELGGLDERYGLGNSEDVAFCEQVKERGGKLLVEPAVFVTHAGSVTFLATLGAEGYAALLAENAAKRRGDIGIVIGG